MNATLTIDSRERDTLHGLLSRRLLILVKNPSGLAKAEGITVAELYERLGDDLRLMGDIGWPPDTDREAVVDHAAREARRDLEAASPRCSLRPVFDAA